MATYLQGVTDSGFNPVQYSPNLSLLANSIDRATARYETNFAKVSKGYNDILSAPILNDGYSQKRDQYLSEIKDKLKTISTTDLSVQSNVNDAENLYAPFWEDKTMLSHIADTKQRQSQLQEQNRIAKEHPDYDNSTALSVMNYNMNKIKTSTDPNIINTIPLTKATALRNNPKEFQEWLKKNEWKSTFETTQNGRIYKQTNGANTVSTYNELYRDYLGNSAADQYNMYGEYYKIQAIQGIKNKEKETTGVEIDDDEAVKRIPIYYVDQQVKNIELQNKSLETEFAAARENALTFNTDPEKYKTYIEKGKDIQKQLADNTKKKTLLETKGLGNPEDKKSYDNLLNSISINPTGFFAEMTLNKDAEIASKMAAGNQSLTINDDPRYTEQIKSSQWAQEQALRERQYQLDVAKYEHPNTKTSSSTRSTSATTITNPDGTVTTVQNTVPLVTIGSDNNKIEDAVQSFESKVSNLNNTALAATLDILKSSKSTIFTDILKPNEVAIVSGDMQTKDYTQTNKILVDVVARLKSKNVPESVTKNIKDPMSLITTVTDYYKSNIAKLQEQNDADILKGVFNKDRQKIIDDNMADYIALTKSRTMLDNAYAYQKEFDEKVNSKLSNSKYADIRIKKKDGTYGLVTAQNLVEQYDGYEIDENGNTKKVKLPYELMKQYVNGTLKENPEDLYHYNPYDTKGSGRTKIGTKYTITDPKTNKEYIITDVVKDFGTSKNLKKKLDVGIAKFKQAIPEDIQQSIRNSTGQMGRVITFQSDPSKENDYADQLTFEFFNDLTNNVGRTGDEYNIINAGDFKDDLTKKIIPGIQSNPKKGLVSIQYHPIGAGDPTKRSVTFKYDREILKANTEDKDLKKSLDKFNGEINFEIKDDASLKGFPKAYDGSFYDFLLSKTGKVLSQENVDENYGLKYNLFKNPDGSISYNAGIKIVTVDPKTNTPSYSWVNYNNVAEPFQDNGYSTLPPGFTVEDFISSLRTGMIEQNKQNSLRLEKALDPVQQPDYGTKQTLETLHKEFETTFNHK
jgi:hypothetical protein